MLKGTLGFFIRVIIAAIIVIPIMAILQHNHVPFVGYGFWMSYVIGIIFLYTLIDIVVGKFESKK